MFIEGELRRVRTVLTVLLVYRIDALHAACRGIFPTRTPRIKTIEYALHCALFSSISSVMLLGIPYENRLNLIITQAVESVSIEFTEDVKELWKVAKLIQKNWRHVISNPEYLMCRRRLFYELETLRAN